MVLAVREREGRRRERISVHPMSTPRFRIRSAKLEGSSITSILSEYNLVTTDGVNVNNNCTLQALADGQTGAIVLQQTQVGRLGNLPQSTIRSVGNWTLDGNLGKTFRITESKSLQVRVDATNIMNHPTPAAPILSLAGSADFGSIAQNGNTPAKSGTRSFQGQVRFSF